MLGSMFRVMLFGESHGPGVGVLIYGCPPGVEIDEDYINRELARRRPGGRYVSPRKEEDRVKILSGVFKGYTTGAPIALFIENRDVVSKFYEKIKNTPRPGHADYVARVKYMGYNDYRGGGIFSGRRTAGLVAAGAVAKRFLSRYNINVYSYVVRIGPIAARVEPRDSEDFKAMIESSPVRCPDPHAARLMQEYIDDVRRRGDSVGGIVETIVYNVPVGLGEPPHEGLDSELAKAVLSIPGVKGVEFGAGFKLGSMHGSEANDEWIIEDGVVKTRTNNAGGIIGGISTGMPIVFRTVFKPTSTIRLPQRTVNLETMEETSIIGAGRHDPCIAIRGSVVVEAVTYIVLADQMLRWLSWQALRTWKS